MKIQNSKGTIYYGMHFYPGVAEYKESGKDAFRVFLNEDTIRRMDPTFAGRPIFVEHVDGVDENIDELKKDADGWVIESFFNAADGKHWVKFIVTGERAERAIKNGYRLSNAYLPKGQSGPAGVWNGVQYDQQITDGEYEHLAIVRTPRYDESVILTPDEFKAYNEEQRVELERLKNSKEEKPQMKLNIFKKQKVENAGKDGIDFDGLIVMLPKSKREVELTTLVNEADAAEEAKGKEQMANGDHMVELDGEKMSLNALLEKHKSMCSELAEMKGEKENGDGSDADGEGYEEEVDTDSVDNKEESEEAEEKEKSVAKKNAADKAKKDAADAAAKAKKEHFDKLKNAHLNDTEEEQVIFNSSESMVERGRQRYGSGK